MPGHVLVDAVLMVSFQQGACQTLLPQTLSDGDPGEDM